LAGRRERGGGPEPVNGEGTVHMAAHGRGQAVKAQVHIASSSCVAWIDMNTWHTIDDDAAA